MYEIKNDAFYDFIRPYDSYTEYHFVGEVDYHLLKNDKPYEGLQSHRVALLIIFFTFRNFNEGYLFFSISVRIYKKKRTNGKRGKSCIQKKTA